MAAPDDEYAEFVSLSRRFLREVLQRAPVANTEVFVGLLRDHFGADPAQLPVVSDKYRPLEHPNLQRAVEEFAARGVRPSRLFGILGGQRGFAAIGLQDLAGAPSHVEMALGPVEYENRPVAVDATMACIALGLYLVVTADGPVALLIHPDAQRGPQSHDIVVDVAAGGGVRAETVVAELRRLARIHNVYRGQMISLGTAASPFGPMAGLGVTFHDRPTVTRQDIVLPPAILERVERHILGIGEAAPRLLAAKRHLKRGLLLHGAPGTGKTLTVRYLAAQMSEATVIVLSGMGLAAIETSCAMARDLAPTLVVLEDVDLVAQERSLPGGHGQPLLFQLMNEIEGIGEDVDVAFVLTTNRPDLLEPALAARPGRVDLAVELDRPDAAARRQLMELYAREVRLAVVDWDGLVQRTEGVSPAFMKEWFRSAVLAAGDADAEITDARLHTALDELLEDASSLTRVLLGGAADRAAASGAIFPGPDGLP
ncbi:MAG: ATP-binding protein, partial [Actinomycetota bacterium]|nr:ATP-binding protein [Actinomycetota bacterium]